MQVLTDLRTHQQNVFAVARLTAAVVVTSGLATEPRALLNSKTDLQGMGAAVTSEIHVCEVERALKLGIDSADWAYFWRNLCPELGHLLEDAPEYGLSFVERLPDLV